VLVWAPRRLYEQLPRISAEIFSAIKSLQKISHASRTGKTTRRLTNGALRVPRWKQRKRGRIYHTQTLNPDDSCFRVDDCHGIRKVTHLACIMCQSKPCPDCTSVARFRTCATCVPVHIRVVLDPLVDLRVSRHVQSWGELWTEEDGLHR